MRSFITAVVVSALVAFTLSRTQSVQAQTFTVIHNFTGGVDGAYPLAGLTIDRGGNLYGTTFEGGYTGGNCSSVGTPGCGVLFRLSYKGSGWVVTPLYSFQGGNDGERPFSPLVFGPNGTLYSTTTAGGGTGCANQPGCGTVFNARPPAHASANVLGNWGETVLYAFQGGNDGATPWGGVVFDQEGNLYGTTIGGEGMYGTVYELSPSGGGWIFTTIYSFTGGNDGYEPVSGLVFDSAGNLYGTTSQGGLYGFGTIYELTPAGAGWSKAVLHNFHGFNDGYEPLGGLIVDQSGNFYGTASLGGTGGGGTVYELSPSGSGWAFTTIYSFTGSWGPWDSLTMDAVGNLYGTTYHDGQWEQGSVFELTHADGGWTYSDLHDFTGGSDGGISKCTVTLDSVGNIYGTASQGGNYDSGVVWEITP